MCYEVNVLRTRKPHRARHPLDGRRWILERIRNRCSHGTAQAATGFGPFARSHRRSRSETRALHPEANSASVARIVGFSSCALAFGDYKLLADFLSRRSNQASLCMSASTFAHFGHATWQRRNIVKIRTDVARLSDAWKMRGKHEKLQSQLPICGPQVAGAERKKSAASDLRSSELDAELRTCEQVRARWACGISCLDVQQTLACCGVEWSVRMPSSCLLPLLLPLVLLPHQPHFGNPPRKTHPHPP